MEIPHEIKISSVTGTHYEIGNQLGQKAKADYGPDYIDKFLKNMTDESIYRSFRMRSKLSPSYIREVFPVVEDILQGVHPEILEEMKGFAQGLGDDYQKFVVFVNNFDKVSGCSQFFLNSHFARNYDDAPGAVENEFFLTQPTDSLRSFGAATSSIERLDGINEAGLVVSLTYGAGYSPVSHGIGSAMFTRIVLDKAGSIDEALGILEKAPYVTQNNVMIADANGKSIVIEGSAGKHQVRKAEGGIMICANSYLHPDMHDQQKDHNITTTWREQQMLAAQHGLTTRDAMMDFLTADFPQGLFEPYYTDGLGTLWSVVYTPSNHDIYLATGEKGPNRREVKLNLDDPNLTAKLPIVLSTHLHDVDLGPRIPLYKS